MREHEVRQQLKLELLALTDQTRIEPQARIIYVLHLELEFIHHT